MMDNDGIKEFADPLQGTCLVMRDVQAIFQMFNCVKQSPIPIKDCTTKEYQKGNRIGDNSETEKRIQARLSSGTSCRV